MLYTIQISLYFLFRLTRDNYFPNKKILITMIIECNLTICLPCVQAHDWIVNNIYFLMLRNLCRRFMIFKMHKIIANTAQSVYDLNHVPDILVARFRDITRYRYCLFYRKIVWLNISRNKWFTIFLLHLISLINKIDIRYHQVVSVKYMTLQNLTKNGISIKKFIASLT